MIHEKDTPVDYVTPDEMKELESSASAYGLGVAELMENAGRAVAQVVEREYGYSPGRSVLVVCGNGNNGGDGFVAARHLSDLGWKVRVMLLTIPAEIKTAEARENWRRLAPPIEVEIITNARMLAERREWMDEPMVILDAIFGTGIRGEIREPALTAIIRINRSRAARVAIDIPSGLDPSSGEIRGTAVEADMTVALHAPKIGLRHRERYTGEIIIVPIGIRESNRR